MSFESYYLENRKILIANTEPVSITETSLERAINVCLNVNGIDPRKLAKYPSLIADLEKIIKDTGKDVLVIERQFMNDLSRALTESTVNSIEGLFEKLSVNSKANDILRRILKITKAVDECFICCSGALDTTFDCLHTTCSSCADKITRCPFCRETINLRMNHEELKKFLVEKESREHVESKQNERIQQNLPKFKLVENLSKFVDNRLKGILMKSGSVEAQMRMEIQVICQFHPNMIISVLEKKKVNSMEALCFTLGVLYHFERANQNVTKLVSKMIKSPIALIRFLSAFELGDPVPEAKPKLDKIPNGLKKLIIKLLNDMDDEAAQMEIRRRCGFWVWLFKHLHVGQKKYSKYAQAQSLATVTRNGRWTYELPMANFNKHYIANDTKLFTETFQKSKGLFFRLMRCSIMQFNDLDDNLLKPLFSKVSTAQLVELFHVSTMMPQLSSKNEIHRITNGIYWWAKKPQYSNIGMLEKKSQQVITLIQEELCKRRVKFDRLIVDNSCNWDNLYHHKGRPPKVPLWSSATVMSPCDRFEVNPNDKVVLFIHWTNGDTRVDLDLSVVLYDASGSEIGTISYYNLEQFGMKHSGDLTDAPRPNGASEYIIFKPSDVVNFKEVENIVMTIHSFNSVAFESMGSASVGIGIFSDGKGFGPAGSTVKAVCDLCGKAKINLSAAFNLKDNSFTFINSNISTKETKRAYAVSTTGKILSCVHENFMSWRSTRAPPSFSKLLSAYYCLFKEAEFSQEKKLFVRRQNEDIANFMARIKEFTDCDEYQPSSTPSIYFGTSCVADLVEKSVVISKEDPLIENDDIVWTSDPLSFLD